MCTFILIFYCSCVYRERERERERDAFFSLIKLNTSAPSVTYIILYHIISYHTVTYIILYHMYFLLQLCVHSFCFAIADNVIHLFFFVFFILFFFLFSFCLSSFTDVKNKNKTKILFLSCFSIEENVFSQS